MTGDHLGPEAVILAIGCLLGGVFLGSTGERIAARRSATQAEAVIEDKARVEEEKTEQAYSYPDVVMEVCKASFVEQHGEGLCRQGLCLASVRDGSEADPDTCDRYAAAEVRMEARRYCDELHPGDTTEAKACLSWFVIQK